DASLTIAPESAEGKAGETIGEFTVTTSADSVPLTLDAPEGVELVDVETGEAVETASNGDVFGFKVPKGTEAGEATVSGTVSATVNVGRLFKGTEAEPTQTLITADGQETEVTAGAKVSWTAGGGEETPTPEPSEPEPSEPNEPSPSEPAPSPRPPARKPDDKPAPGEDDDNGGRLPGPRGALGGPDPRAERAGAERAQRAEPVRAGPEPEHPGRQAGRQARPGQGRGQGRRPAGHRWRPGRPGRRGRGGRGRRRCGHVPEPQAPQ